MEKPLRRANLNRAIRDYIKQYILDNDLVAGDPLPPEAQLAEEMGVGRSSVREAIRALQSLGIVETRQGDGLYVREYNFDPVLETLGYGMRFDATTLLELTQIRLLLECATIEAAVKRITAMEIRQIEDLMAAWQQRSNGGIYDTDLDEEYHRILYSALGNETLMKLLQAFWVAFKNYDDPVLQEGQPIHESLEHHRRILQAVRTGDARLARQLLIRHFDDLTRRVGRIEGRQDQDWLVSG